jgi:RNA polymerase sigma factor (sigma-70 family)
MATQQLNRLAGLLGSAYAAARLGAEPDAALLARCRGGDDRAAFEALVRRHGPRVLAACRKVLADPADIDDAFQATFLVLLQKPRAVRKADAVGAWLYGVAHRVAVRARDLAARRRTLLKRVLATDEAPPAPDLSWKEACAALHHELDRLPDTLRLPLVLCYLEGLSRDEAAAQLGWTLNEVRGRLERGRDRLRRRLQRRGIALSAGLLAAAGGGGAATAGGLPTRLIEGVLRAAGGRPSAAAAALAHGGAAAVIPAGFKLLSAVALAAGLLVGAGARDPDLKAGPTPDPAKAAEPPAAARKADAPADGQPPEFAGRVLDPDGQPVTGARVHVLYYTPKALPVPERAVTDADGRFRFTLKADDFDRSYQSDPWRGAHVVARADGFALGWVQTDSKNPSRDGTLTIRLRKDDPPLTGRLLSLEGKPLAGVTVRLTELLAPKPGQDLGGFIPALRARKAGYPVQRDFLTGFEGWWLGRDVGTLFPAVTTGPGGRFRLPGVGADRLVAVRFESPAVETRTLRVLTRAAETVTVPEWDQAGILDEPTLTYTGNGFDFALAPGRTVTGVVRDKVTRRPIPGAVVVSEKTAAHGISGRQEFRAVADKDGRYTLHGLPLGNGNVLRAGPSGDEPYLMQLRDVPTPPGFNPAPVDFELTRGVILTVRPVDAASGKPVAGFAEYFTFRDNPAYREIKGFAMPHRNEQMALDGRFRLVVPPGPGLVAFRAKDERYPIAVGADLFKDRTDRAFIQTVPYLVHATNHHVLHPVEPKAGAQALDVEIKLDAGKSVTGRVLDPDGKPLAGVLARGLKSSTLVFGRWEPEPLPGVEFAAVGVDPRRPRAVVFVHPGKKLAGFVRLTGEEKGPVEVRLQPWATLSGRLVDADGRPQADVRIGFVQRIDEPDPAGVGDLPRGEVRTDRDGRFNLEGFAAGLRYSPAAMDSRRILGRLGEGMTFQAGEKKDVGDITLRPPQ